MQGQNYVRNLKPKSSQTIVLANPYNKFQALFQASNSTLLLLFCETSIYGDEEGWELNESMKIKDTQSVSLN